MTGLFGSVFDPPHNGHVALLREAHTHFGFDRVVVLVVADPGHKQVATDASVRLGLAQAAFPSSLFRGYPGRVEFFEIEPLDVSSSDIRHRVARGEPIGGLVPPAVAAEIERLGLYRSGGPRR